MIYHILAIGDVVGEQGLAHLSKSLRAVKKLKDVHFTVVNGENAAGTGILPRQVEDLYAAGADVVTLGNHTFRRQQIAGRLEEDPYLLRPANFTGRAPGRGWGVYDCGHIQIGVMNLIGRCGLDFHADNPFIAADRLLRGDAPRFTVVDPVGHPHPRAHGGRAGAAQGDRLCDGPGHDGAHPLGARHPAGAERGAVSGGRAGALSGGGRALQDGGGPLQTGWGERPVRGRGTDRHPLTTEEIETHV